GSTFTVSIPFGTAHLPSERINRAPSGISTSVRAHAFVAEALRWLPDDGGAERDIADREQAELLAASVAGGTHDRQRGLVAVDNADMRDYLVRLLAPGFAVEAVPHGQVALERVRAHPPALVLSDVMMPHLDGFGLIKALRADERLREIPVILLSARAGDEAK